MLASSQSGTQIYKRLLGYVKPYKGRLIVAILASQGFALATALISATLYIIVNGLENKTEVVIENIPHVPFLMNIRFSVAWVPLIIVGVFSLRSFFEYLSHYQMASVGIRAIRKIRDDLYDHLVHLSHDFYHRGRTGDFLSRILNDVGSIQGAITDVISDLVKEPFVILYNIPMVLIFGGKYALIALAVFPLVVIPITLLGKSLRRTTKKMQQRSADITSFIGETLAGIHIVKAFNREDAENARFQKINKGVFDYFKKMIRVTIIQRPLVEVMGAVGAAAAIWFSLQHLSLDRFTAFVVALFVFYEPIKKISKVNSTVQQSIAAGSRIFEVFDAVPSIQNREGAKEFREELKEIHFEHVFFQYEPEALVLEDIDLRVERGEVLAIVGPSGSGKTTLVNLLPRFYDPTRGIIRISGTDIRNLTLESLRRMIGIVSQDTILFNMTVAENIAYGQPDAAMEKIIEAARAAHADHFIEALPQGYDTPLGERGLNLSGGQRQRIAIARALLKNAPILILDEATSHLDTGSERIVQTALENLMKGRTVFVIAHRLSTVQKANRILVIDNGKIIQEGTNEQLLDEGGEYKKLHDLQFNI
ncbi:MAG: ATP-binding cassette domain-containing protein [Candidatus Omnitrophica bacterium]|nr:ATP-binding cassette domain-containing protein [Candidatus Omnitrophota bacterium]